MNKNLALLHQAHFGARPLFNGISAGGEILYLGGQGIIAGGQCFVDFFLRLQLSLQLAHPLPPALSPPERVLRNGGQQNQNNQQQAHEGSARPVSRAQAQRRL